MIILNNELFNPNAKKGEKFYDSAQQYQKEVESLKRKHGNVIIFRRTRKDSFDNEGRSLPVPPMILPLRGKRIGDNGVDQDLLYTEAIPNKKDGIYQPKKSGMIVYDELTVHMNKHPDLAWFLYYVSNLYGKEYILYDKDEIKKKELEERRNKVALENALFGDSSLSDDTILRIVAESWGINIYKKEDAQLRFELEELLKRRDAEKRKHPSVKGSKEFLKDIKNIGEKVFKKSYLQRGFSSKVMSKEDSGDIIMNQTGEKLFFVPPDKEAEWFDYFAEHVIKDENLWPRLVKANVNNGYIDNATDTDQLKWLFKFVNKEPTKKTLGTIKKELKGYLA